jgi:hypothetical protein
MVVGRDDDDIHPWTPSRRLEAQRHNRNTLIVARFNLLNEWIEDIRRLSVELFANLKFVDCQNTAKSQSSRQDRLA